MLHKSTHMAWEQSIFTLQQRNDTDTYNILYTVNSPYVNETRRQIPFPWGPPGSYTTITPTQLTLGPLSMMLFRVLRAAMWLWMPRTCMRCLTDVRKKGVRERLPHLLQSGGALHKTKRGRRISRLPVVLRVCQSLAMTTPPMSTTNPFRWSHGTIESLGYSLGANARDNQSMINCCSASFNQPMFELYVGDLGSFAYGTRNSLSYMEGDRGGALDWSFVSNEVGECACRRGDSFVSL